MINWMRTADIISTHTPNCTGGFYGSTHTTCQNSFFFSHLNSSLEFINWLFSVVMRKITTDRVARISNVEHCSVGIAQVIWVSHATNWLWAQWFINSFPLRASRTKVFVEFQTVSQLSAQTGSNNCHLFISHSYLLQFVFRTVDSNYSTDVDQKVAKMYLQWENATKQQKPTKKRLMERLKNWKAKWKERKMMKKWNYRGLTWTETRVAHSLFIMHYYLWGNLVGTGA